MASLRIWIILSWIALPTVMFGGYSLLRLLNRGDALTPFQVDCFRAGHAHAGVLLMMSLLYYMFLDRTALPVSVKQAACVGLFVGILAQSGGFFLHMAIGKPSTANAMNNGTAHGGALKTGKKLTAPCEAPHAVSRYRLAT